MIGWTLSCYLSARFLRMIGAVFLMISGMVYVVDFIELLRRTGDIPGVSAGYIAYFSFLRVPSVSEQIMPFCVLFGTMATFLNLTRTLELLVARAVGVSVWGFLVPPLAIAAATGIGSVLLFNPVCRGHEAAARMRSRRSSSAATASKTMTKACGSDNKASTEKFSSMPASVRRMARKLSPLVVYVYDLTGTIRIKGSRRKVG